MEKILLGLSITMKDTKKKVIIYDATILSIGVIGFIVMLILLVVIVNVVMMGNLVVLLVFLLLMC